MNEMSARRVIIVDAVIRTSLVGKEAFLQTRTELCAQKDQAINDCVKLLLDRIKDSFAQDKTIQAYLEKHPKSNFILEVDQYRMQVLKAVTASFDRYEKRPFKNCILV